jgi:hypothetical protein
MDQVFPDVTKLILLIFSVDNYVSACASCHSTSQKIKHADMYPKKDMTSEQKMRWFRNLPAGEPFDENDVSGDYSLQLMVGWANYQAWSTPTTGVAGLWHKTKYVFNPNTTKEVNAIEEKRKLLRD